MYIIHTRESAILPVKIILRDLQRSDKVSVFELLQDKEVMRYLGPKRPLTDDESNIWFENALIEQSRFAIAHSEENTLIGFVGIKELNGTKDFGYFIRRRYWGQGIATQACRLALTKILATEQLDQIDIFIAHDNLASIAVAKRLGLKRGMEVERSNQFGHLYMIDTEILSGS